MRAKNLLKETEEALQENGYEWKDVKAIQTDARAIPVEDFKKFADREYDSGYGTEFVRMDLVILLNDGAWFSRGTYDGSEWWECNKYPELKEGTGSAVEEDIWERDVMFLDPFRSKKDEEEDEDDLK